MNDKMKKALTETLGANEKVLWESGTQPFRILDGRDGKRTLLRWVISTFVMGAFAVLYAVNGGNSIGFFAVVLVILGILVFAPVMQYHQLLAQRYFITAKRALLIRKDGSAYSMELPEMGEYRIYPLDFGGAAIALGTSLLEEKDKQLRWRSTHPDGSLDFEGVTAAHGLVFYHVERAEEAMRLLREGAAKEA